MPCLHCVGWAVVCYQFRGFFIAYLNLIMPPKGVEGAFSGSHSLFPVWGRNLVLCVICSLSRLGLLCSCYLLLASQLLCRYAIGGYDGTTMVCSTEIYDPRFPVWMVGQPMKHARGYLAAAVLQESIYVIGGVQSNKEFVDVVRNIFLVVFRHA